MPYQSEHALFLAFHHQAFFWVLLSRYCHVSKVITDMLILIPDGETKKKNTYE
jgi:hypothetical protein